MKNPTSQPPAPKNKATRQFSKEQYAALKAEARAPYRGMRKLVYGVCGVSGLMGAMVFLAQLAAGKDVASAFPNFALQVGVVALMIWLFRIDKPSA